MTDRVIIAAFANSTDAYAAASQIKDLGKGSPDRLKIKAGAMFQKDELGNVSPLEEKNRTIWGTLVGGAAGALVGLLAGPAGAAAGAAIGASGGLITDAASDDMDASYVDQVAAWVLPGDTAIVVDADEGDPSLVDVTVASNNGRVYRPED